MEATRPTQPTVHALQTAYQQVLAKRKVNASMLKWSLAFAEAEKERRTSGRGVTLYLL
jgi:hypothetical protein